MDLKLIFAIALRLNASKLIACHNHPSGTCLPSEEDKYLTEQLEAAGGIMQRKLIDHLIITSENVYSFAIEKAFCLGKSGARQRRVQRR